MSSMKAVLVFLFAVTVPFATGARAAADPVRLELTADVQALNLGAVRTIPLTVTAGPDFDGRVSLSLDISELSQVSPQGKVEISVSPQMLRLAPGQSKQSLIQVNVDTMAPSFAAVKLGVNAQAVTPTTVSVVSEPISLAVRAVFEIHLFGGPVPEVWDSPKTVSFSPHAEGVLIRFINADTRAEHYIHSTGPIPHGNNELTRAPALGRDGGAYEYLVTGTQKMKNIYYCHEHENSSEARTLLFNQ